MSWVDVKQRAGLLSISRFRNATGGL